MKKLAIVHILLIALEMTALIHDVRSFGAALFKYYTIDSNVLQLAVSAAIVWWVLRTGRDELPKIILTFHLICAVCLTITFLIAALVLAPQEGFGYYFLGNVAPINHFLGPLLSVVTFIFLEKRPALPRKAVFAPLAATLIYGFAALILNIARIIEGPYFFLEVYKTPPSTVVMWFAIIGGLCLVLAAVYMKLREKAAGRDQRKNRD